LSGFFDPKAEEKVLQILSKIGKLSIKEITNATKLEERRCLRAIAKLEASFMIEQYKFTEKFGITNLGKKHLSAMNIKEK
jgi:DNA-binding Lrp family transcriptional regulator